MEVEEKLKNLIIGRYSSVRAFALEIGLKQQTLDQILKRGVSNARLENVSTICNALGISLDALNSGSISFVDSPFYLDEDEADLIKKIRALSDTEREMVECMVSIASANKKEEGK